MTDTPVIRKTLYGLISLLVGIVLSLIVYIHSIDTKRIDNLESIVLEMQKTQSDLQTLIAQNANNILSNQRKDIELSAAIKEFSESMNGLENAIITLNSKLE